MTYRVKHENFRSSDILEKLGLSNVILEKSINSVYEILAAIDTKLLATQTPRLAELMELANLSSFLGNLVGGAIASNSDGVFRRNRPHTYPDLLHVSGDTHKDIEIKVALEGNKPKGHLPKSGHYLTFRYVLGETNGDYERGTEKRGNIIWIWEIKFGLLTENDFSFSSTKGDSGKTAVIKTNAFSKMDLLYFDHAICPYVKIPYLDKGQKSLL